LQYLETLRTLVYPAVQKYQPDLICVSSGFDALDGDLEGNMALQPVDFAAMTDLVCDWADEFCGGKLLMTLEGGYRIETVSEALISCLTVLNNRTIQPPIPPEESPC
jgi:acetoin utilization deacetylase AcuC-like enzyme